MLAALPFTVAIVAEVLNSSVHSVCGCLHLLFRYPYCRERRPVVHIAASVVQSIAEQHPFLKSGIYEGDQTTPGVVLSESLCGHYRFAFAGGYRGGISMLRKVHHCGVSSFLQRLSFREQRMPGRGACRHGIRSA